MRCDSADKRNMRLVVLVGEGAQPIHQIVTLEMQVGDNAWVDTAPDLNSFSFATESKRRLPRAPPSPFLSQQRDPPQRDPLAEPHSHTIGAGVGVPPTPSRASLRIEGPSLKPTWKKVGMNQRESFVETNERENEGLASKPTAKEDTRPVLSSPASQTPLPRTPTLPVGWCNH